MRKTAGITNPIALDEESPFHLCAPAIVYSHPAYGACTALALLLPPVGIIAHFILMFRSNALDRALGRLLFWRALTLPAIAVVMLILVNSALYIIPNGRAWAWW